MNATQNSTTRPASMIRMLHASLAAGIILFALVIHFVGRPAQSDADPVQPVVIWVILGMSLLASAVAPLLRRRVPQRSTDESADLFWTRASAPALQSWMPLEMGALLGVVAYWLSGLPVALGAAGIAFAGLILLSPARLERT